MLPALLVAAGGALGSVARYWLGLAALSAMGNAFPFGTILVNVLGSFALGALTALSLERGVLEWQTRMFFTVGFCGAFTTMSAFSYETVALLYDGRVLLALAYAGIAVPGCVVATWLGIVAARAL